MWASGFVNPLSREAIAVERNAQPLDLQRGAFMATRKFPLVDWLVPKPFLRTRRTHAYLP